MEWLTVGGMYVGTTLLVWLGCHFGGKWIDSHFVIPPPPDPGKPIVLPHAQDR